MVKGLSLSSINDLKQPDILVLYEICDAISLCKSSWITSHKIFPKDLPAYILMGTILFFFFSKCASSQKVWVHLIAHIIPMAMVAGWLLGKSFLQSFLTLACVADNMHMHPLESNLLFLFLFFFRFSYCNKWKQCCSFIFIFHENKRCSKAVVAFLNSFLPFFKIQNLWQVENVECRAGCRGNEIFLIADVLQVSTGASDHQYQSPHICLSRGITWLSAADHKQHYLRVFLSWYYNKLLVPRIPNCIPEL